MTTLSLGLHVTGKLSNEEYADHINYDLDKVSTLLAIGIKYDCEGHEIDALMRVGYQRLLDLQGRIGKRKEEGGFA